MSPPVSRKSKRPSPLSVRLNEVERRQLEEAACGEPLSTYIKHRALSELGRSRTANVRSLGQLLGQLGKSELADSLARIARQAEAGTLYCDEGLHAQIRNACEEVRAMRGLLMRALGKAGGPEVHP